MSQDAQNLSEILQEPPRRTQRKLHLLYNVVRIGLGLVYLISGLAKMLSPWAAANLISMTLGMEKLPADILSYGVSAFEILIGLQLVRDTVVALAAFGSILLLLTSIIIAFQFLGGPVDCGCFGALIVTKTDGTFFIRNIVLLICSMFLLQGSASIHRGGQTDG